MGSSLQWCVVQTQLRQERLALENLQRQGFEGYLPMHLARVEPKGQPPRTIPSPLFQRYLFARVDLAVDRWRSLYSTRGVSGVLGSSERPSKVVERLIADIKATEVKGFVQLTPAQIDCAWRAGDRVAYGAFRDAIFHELVDGKRALILVSLLGRDTLQQVDLDDLS